MSDLVAGMNLDVFPIIGLILFFLAFCVIVWRVLATRQDQVDRNASIPLTSDPVEPRTPPAVLHAAGGDRAADTSRTDEKASGDARRKGADK